MNTQERTHLLKKFLTQIQKKINKMQHDPPTEKPYSPLKIIERTNSHQILTPPDTQILNEIITNQSQITSSISDTHHKINHVLEKINHLKTQKDNVEKLMDAMTAIMEIRKLSFGINNQDQETVYRNLVTYYQIKPKVHYCDMEIQTIEQQITTISERFKKQFNDQLLKTGNSQNISIVAKILQIINENNGNNGNSNFNLNNIDHTTKQLSKFYIQTLQKELKSVQEQLFKIPIVGINLQGVYIFFQLAKNSMKMVVNLVTTYRNNILKVVKFNGLSEVIIQIFTQVLQTIILQILQRERKYFQVDKINMEAKKLVIKDKEYQRLTHYFNEFNAIWNQVQRLKIYLEEEILQEQYPEGWKDYINKLQNCTNSPKLLQFNQMVITATKGCLRYQFDKLLKKSPFISSLWQLDSTFFKKYETNSLQYGVQCSEGTDFLEECTSNFIKGIQKSFQTLNTLFISSLINFTNHNLLYEDTFYTFTQLFNRNLNKLPTTDKKPLLAIILLFNTVFHLPYHLKRLQQLIIPPDLNEDRLKSQINELISTNNQKTSQLINQMIDSIIGCDWVRQELGKDYRRLIQKWNGLQRSVFEKLLGKISVIHSEVLVGIYFNPSVSSSKNITNKRYDLSGAMNIEKEVRSIMSYYNSKSSVSVHQSFQLMLGYSQVLQMENQNEVQKFSQRFKDKFQLQDLKRVWNLRTK